MNRIQPLLFAALSAGMLLGCQEPDQNYASLEELSDEARGFMGVQGVNQRGAFMMAAPGGGGDAKQMINRSYGAVMGLAKVSGEYASDSVLIDNPVTDWVSCAQITQTENTDGSTTYITDYGDGCEEGWGDYKYLMTGKYITTYKNTSSRDGSAYQYDYFSRNKTINYGGSYYWLGDTSSWISNGRSTYTGSSMYDTIKQTFSGNYSWSDTSEHIYGKETYRSKSMGSSSYNQNRAVTISNMYEYETGGEFYRSTVLEPLVMDYSCLNNRSVSASDVRIMPYFTYVSGRERIEYNRNGIWGTFEIDYGSGACDNIIYIYENGKVFKVNLETDYEAIQPKGD